MISATKRKNSGFMAVEILVAVSIITISVLAATAVAQKSVYVANQSTHTAQASFLLEEGAEAVRTVRDNGWSNISALNVSTVYYPSFSGSSWAIVAGTPPPIGIFTRSVSITSVKRDGASGRISNIGSDDPGTKLITVTVSWQEGGTTISKTLQFYIANIFPS